MLVITEIYGTFVCIYAYTDVVFHKKMNININDPDFINKLKSQANILTKERNVVLKKIQPWLDKVYNSNLSYNEKKQKKKEIIDLGNFLYYHNKRIKIVNPLAESPDAIVKKGCKKIGIELKDLIIRIDEKEKESIFKKLFSEIEEELKNDIQKYKGIYKVEFIDSDLSLKNEIKQLLKSEIISLIKGISTKKEYVKNIFKIPYKSINIQKGEATIVGNLKVETVIEKIYSKEKNINRYKNNFKLSEFWLLLVLSGIEKSSDYSYFDQEIFEYNFKTEFNRIFIFDFFKRKVTELKTQKKKQK